MLSFWIFAFVGDNNTEFCNAIFYSLDLIIAAGVVCCSACCFRYFVIFRSFSWFLFDAVSSALPFGFGLADAVCIRINNDSISLYDIEIYRALLMHVDISPLVTAAAFVSIELR